MNLSQYLVSSWFRSLHRCVDEGEGQPEACRGREDGGPTGRWDQGTLQHHLFRHTGWDPALPSDSSTGLQVPDATLPTAADQLLPEGHRQAGGSTAEVWQCLNEPCSDWTDRASPCLADSQARISQPLAIYDKPRVYNFWNLSPYNERPL